MPMNVALAAENGYVRWIVTLASLALVFYPEIKGFFEDSQTNGALQMVA